MLKYFTIGAFGGAITGVPIGPVNVAVIDTAHRHHLKRAIAVGLGGATADMLYALLGVLWFGPWVQTRPHIPPILYGVSGIVLVIYGLTILRSKPVNPNTGTEDKDGQQSYFWSGFGLGMALILFNPSVMVFWVVFLGSQMADVDQAGGIAAAVGIGVGSFAWFTFVAWLAHRGKQFLEKKALLINRMVGLFLMGFGVYSMGKAVHYWLSL